MIDDLDEYAKAIGLVHDQERTGLAEHEHSVRWQPVRFAQDNPRGQYVTIKGNLDCGCAIRDLAAFAAHMREQRGWDIATSGGWGSSGAPGGTVAYTLRARRKSLGDLPVQEPK